MAAEKQLQAAQRFLRGILTLASYEEVRGKQALGVQKSLEKVVSFSAAQVMQRYLLEDLLRARKWLTILAWHFSIRPNRSREFAWCRLAAVLLREATGSLPAAREPREEVEP